jgi:hypothetical protein
MNTYNLANMVYSFDIPKLDALPGEHLEGADIVAETPMTAADVMDAEADLKMRVNRKRFKGIGGDEDVKRAKLRLHVIVDQQTRAQYPAAPAWAQQLCALAWHALDELCVRMRCPDAV